MPLTAPLNDVAPIWSATAPIWTEVMTPNGIATRIVGSSETRVMNQAWSRNSLQEKRRRAMSVPIAAVASTARVTSEPGGDHTGPRRPTRPPATPTPGARRRLGSSGTSGSGSGAAAAVTRVLRWRGSRL